jgi:predicted secreted hydrolase
VTVRTLLLYLLIASIGGCAKSPTNAAGGASTGIRFLGAEEQSAGYARAIRPREFVFPEDHGAHPAYRTEWWYFTGNLTSAEGQAYGVELTFFRMALAPQAAARASGWGTNQIWMAHFALTDEANGRFVAHERLARGALDLAGARTAPLRIWVKDWSAQAEGSNENLVLKLTASEEATGLDLRVTGVVPPVAQGEGGLDAKGPEVGNASHYYSVPEMRAEGTLTVEGRRVPVNGAVWMDREWSTSALSAGTVGWDWFALRLSDGRSLMFYRLREADGAVNNFSGGSLVDRDGGRKALGAEDVGLVARGYWTSAATGVRYPVKWGLTIPSAGLELDIEPYLPNQELDLTVRYWEGAVRARGRGAAGEITGEGYLELAGY